MCLINTIIDKISDIFRRIPQTSPEVIVSMTSYPARINNLLPTLESIFVQTRQPDKIVLWLADTQFARKEEDLPPYLIDLVQQGKIFIKWCNDLKPHKKYFYALQKYSESIVITIDDDLLFEPDMIECLLDSYAKFPRAVSTMRSHLLKREDDRFASYQDILREQKLIIGIPSMRLLATNGAGSLFPPNLLDFKYFDENLIQELCLNTDDLWLKAIEVFSDVPVVQARIAQRLHFVKDSQIETLWQKNQLPDGNDKILENIRIWADTRFGDGYFLNKIFRNVPDTSGRFKAILKKIAGRNTVFYFVPHQDDELLTFGVDICSSVINGKDVHIILCTDGAQSNVRNILNNNKKCSFHKGKHIYDLSEQEFVEARDAEFIQSCLKLGVKQANIHILPQRANDGALTTDFAEAVIMYFLAQYGHKSTVCTIYHDNGETQHPDHKALGLAAENLFNTGIIQKLRFFCEPYCLEENATAFTCKSAGKKHIWRIKHAIKAYSLWKPQQQRYAIGLHSVPNELEALRQKKCAYYFKMRR